MLVTCRDKLLSPFSLIKLLITFILSKITKYKWYRSFFKRKKNEKIYVYFEITKYQNICSMDEK
jgi:hypothetical protein